MKTHKDFDEEIWKILAVLVIFVILTFIVLQLFSKESVSLVKDLLGIASTIFAAFVAIYIFKGWLIQKRLEILSDKSKEYLLEFPNLYLDMVSFFSVFSDFLNRSELYQQYGNLKLLQSIEQLSTDIYQHKFFFYIINFDNSTQELKDLMLKKDEIILDEMSEIVLLLKNYILKEKILNIKNHKELDMRKMNYSFEELQNKIFKSFELLHNKLISYKNYNFEK